VVIASQDMVEVKQLKLLLDNEFEMKVIDVVEIIIGMETKRDRSQKKLFLC